MHWLNEAHLPNLNVTVYTVVPEILAGRAFDEFLTLGHLGQPDN